MIAWGAPWAVVAVLLTTSVPAAAAAPYEPVSEETVLLTLPPASRSTMLTDLVDRWQADKSDPKAASELALHYIQLGQQGADARYFGYAQAVLQPWRNQPAAPADILLAQGVLAQHHHDFNKAVDLIEAALIRTPDNRQGWLNLAMIQTARGDYPAAEAACRGLARYAHLTVSLACRANLMALSGQQKRATDLLVTLSAQADDSALGQWIHTSLGQVYVQRGDYRRAEAAFERALSRPDAYLYTRLADLWLHTGQPERVIILLKDQTHDDALLLRVALAARALGQQQQVETLLTTLRARLRDAALRGDQNHWLNEALLALEFDNNPQRATELALTDWQIEKGLSGARLLARAARASGDTKALATIARWQADTGVQDQQLARSLNRLLAHTEDSQ